LFGTGKVTSSAVSRALTAVNCQNAPAGDQTGPVTISARDSNQKNETAEFGNEKGTELTLRGTMPPPGDAHISDNQGINFSAS
jgi:hypothetical protein